MITASVVISLNAGSVTRIYAPLILLYDRRRHKARLRLISNNPTEALQARGEGGTARCGAAQLCLDNKVLLSEQLRGPWGKLQYRIMLWESPILV